MKNQAAGFERILEVLDLLEIPYQVVGSLASSMYGIPRSTADVDLVVNLRADRVDEFASQLKTDFYADPEMIKEALARRRSFNLIHYASAFKFDIFPLLEDDYSQTQFHRRQFKETRLLSDEPIECAFATAEALAVKRLSGCGASLRLVNRQAEGLCHCTIRTYAGRTTRL
jgi:hypothetical protein